MIEDAIIQQWQMAGLSAEGFRVVTEFGRGLIVEDNPRDYKVALYTTKERISIEKQILEKLNQDIEVFRYRLFFRENVELSRQLSTECAILTREAIHKLKEERSDRHEHGIRAVHKSSDGW